MRAAKKLLFFFLVVFFKIAVATEWIDLTHELNSASPRMPFSKNFQLQTLFKGETQNHYYYAENQLSMPEHFGTHIDAPQHFNRQGKYIHELNLKQLIAPAINMNVSQQTLKNCHYEVSVTDLKNWEKLHGKIAPHTIVLINTGFYHFWPNAKKYLGTDLTGQAGMKSLCFPGISEQALHFLIAERNILAIGIDTASIDFAETKTFPAHQLIGKNNLYAIENLTNLDRLPARGFLIVALPLKIENGTGAPARVVAKI